MAQYNSKGQEIPDNTPLELPIGYRIPEPLEQMIARMVRTHSLVAVKQGLESFEEADDFETEEEEPESKYQMTQMQEENPRYQPSILKKDQDENQPVKPVESVASVKGAGDRRTNK